jgi:cytochrome c
MRSLEFVRALAIVFAVAGCAASQKAPLAARPQAAYGKSISETDLASWNIDIRTPDGAGLPQGSGTVAEGQRVYEASASRAMVLTRRVGRSTVPWWAASVPSRRRSGC